MFKLIFYVQEKKIQNHIKIIIDYIIFNKRYNL
jgi:hypothetical protein